MDSITQATLGAAVGEAMLGRRIGYKGALAGAIMGTIPDLDVLLSPLLSELERISVHRGISHSLLFCLVVAGLSVMVLQRNKSFREVKGLYLYVFSFLVYATHVILDLFTSYGTQIWLPFSDQRVSFDSINIIDPVYTLPLLAGVLISLFRYAPHHARRSVPNRVGLILSTIYLLATLVNKQVVASRFQEAADRVGITMNDMLTVPVKVGNLTWYGVIKDDAHLHIGRFTYLNQEPITFEQFPINEELLDGLDPELTDRMKWFAQGFYTVAESDGHIRVYNMQCDMQGIRHYGEYKAPTAFYFQIDTTEEGGYTLETGMHAAEE